jgi:UDP-galactopyranose mutase
MKRYDYLIVGCGFAGSVIAERISSVLNKNVLVIEKRNHIGGNCYDYKDENEIIVHKYGPHLFHTDNKNVFEYLSKFTDWHFYEHRVVACVDGKKIPLPFNLNTLYFIYPNSKAKKIEEKLISKYGRGKKISILEMMKENDKDLKEVAMFVYDKIFKNYTAKQWGLKVEDLTPEVTSRVPIYIERDNRYFQDLYQFVPLEGYTKIFENMLSNKKIKVILNKDFKELIKIDFNKKKIYFDNKEFKGKLIYTAMIDEFFDFKYGRLPYRSLDLKFETVNKKYYQEAASVNYPNDYGFTRITEFKHIHPVNVNKTIILKEYPKSYNPKTDIAYYPVFTPDNMKLYLKYKEEADKFKNLLLLGRLAEYRYYDMDDVVKRALDVFEEKIK